MPNFFLHGGTAAAACDFQWCGGGPPARDLAYVFAAALDPGALAQERALLAFYHAELTRAVARAPKKNKKKKGGGGGGSGGGSGGGGVPTLAALTEQYGVALLDFARWLVGYGLWGGPAEAWFLEKCDALLAALEEKGAAAATGGAGGAGGAGAGGGGAAPPDVYARALGVASS